jgi:hypothetical protein
MVEAAADPIAIGDEVDRYTMSAVAHSYPLVADPKTSPMHPPDLHNFAPSQSNRHIPKQWRVKRQRSPSIQVGDGDDISVPHEPNDDRTNVFNSSSGESGAKDA